MAQNSSIEWTIKTITVLCKDKARRVCALASGNIAIHPSLTETGFARRRYTITHIPTGLRMGPPFITKSFLDLWLEWAMSREYEGTAVVDMSACEIVGRYDELCDRFVDPNLRDKAKEADTKEYVTRFWKCEHEPLAAEKDPQ